MFNSDEIMHKKVEITNALADAIKTADTEKINQAMTDFQNFVSEQVMAENQNIVDAADRSVLSARGIRQLTSEEIKFYNALIDPKNSGIEGGFSSFPPTVIDNVMEDIRQSHPLLAAINFVNTGVSTRWIVNAQGAQSATWNALETEFTKELVGKIEFIDMTISKLTAYFYVTKDMLKLGPVWVDRYVRAVLAEAVAVGLETAIVAGTGHNQPVGMMRDLSAAVDPSTGYKAKKEKKLTSLDPQAYGDIISELAVTPLGNYRAVDSVILIVNPADYLKSIRPATTMLTPTGTYVGDVLPFPTKIIQSVGVEKGKAVIGIAKNYFAGLASSKEGEIEYDDSFKFLQDLRTYTVRLYGNGRPVDNTSFAYLDITGIANTYPTYNTKTA